MKTLAIITLSLLGLGIVGCFAQIDTTVLGFIIIASWGTTIPLAILGLKK
jgi:hypothetical protein